MHEFEPVSLLDGDGSKGIAGEDFPIALHDNHSRLKAQVPEEPGHAQTGSHDAVLAVKDDGHLAGSRSRRFAGPVHAPIPRSPHVASSMCRCPGNTSR